MGNAGFFKRQTRLTTVRRSMGLLLGIGSLTACSQLPHSSEASANGLPAATPKQPQPVLSQWHYDSLPLCSGTAEDFAAFELPVRVDLWDRLREGFAIDQDINRRIHQELSWYGRHPSYMARVTERGSRYLFYITEELERRDMPMEIALLPIVESAFDPFAYSHGRASGMWQVIPGTGKMLGLKQNWWYDGRRDVVASTHAAMDYLQQLHSRFDGDWLLALAAYNSGAGNVSKAMRKNRKKGLPTDYWSLDLPRETEAYVPRLLAMKQLVLHPEDFGLTLHPVPNEPFFAIVNVQSQIDLAQAADMAGLSMEEFYHLNPGFNRWATDPEGPHELLVPVDAYQQFVDQLAELPQAQRVTWDRYQIQSGDTLSEIATRYKTTVDSLQAINGLDGVRIRAGKTLLVPIASAESQHYVLSAAERLRQKQNRGKGHKVQYQVRAGDSLWTIGRRYKVSTRELAKWNGIAPGDPIRPGQNLVIWQDKPEKSDSAVLRKVAYKVRRGDSLSRIASKFNLKVADIVTWNSVNPSQYLQPGDNLTLFVDVTQQ